MPTRPTHVIGSLRAFGVIAPLFLFGCNYVPSDALHAEKLISKGHGTCALSHDGTVRCWGSTPFTSAEDSRFATVVAEPEKVFLPDAPGALMAVGISHTCEIRRDQIVWCWGADNGGLGNGTKLPLPSCEREGIGGTSEEREATRGPTIVRTGEAGELPLERRAAWLLAIALTLFPIAAAFAFHRSSERKSRAIWQAPMNVRAAALGGWLLTAMFTPLFVAWTIYAAAGALHDRSMELALPIVLVPGVLLGSLAVTLRATRSAMLLAPHAKKALRRAAGLRFAIQAPLALLMIIVIARHHANASYYLDEEVIWFFRNVHASTGVATALATGYAVVWLFALIAQGVLMLLASRTLRERSP